MLKQNTSKPPSVQPALVLPSREEWTHHLRKQANNPGWAREHLSKSFFLETSQSKKSWIVDLQDTPSVHHIGCRKYTRDISSAIPVLVLVHYTRDIHYWRLVSHREGLLLDPHWHPIQSNSRQDENLRYRAPNPSLLAIDQSEKRIGDQLTNQIWDRTDWRGAALFWHQESNINGKSQLKMIVSDIQGNPQQPAKPN